MQMQQCDAQATVLPQCPLQENVSLWFEFVKKQKRIFFFDDFRCFFFVDKCKFLNCQMDTAL